MNRDDMSYIGESTILQINRSDGSIQLSHCDGSITAVPCIAEPYRSLVGPLVLDVTDS